MYTMSLMLKFRKVQTLFIFWFLIVSSVPLSTISFIIYKQQAESIKQREIEKLSAIRGLKVQQINSWYDINRETIRSLTEEIERSFGAPDELNDILRAKSKIHSSFTGFTMYDRNGTYLAGARGMDSSIFNDLSDEDKSEVFTTGIIKDKVSKNIAMFFYTYLKDKEYILAGKTDLDNKLFPVLQNRTGVGSTGETLIVNSNSYALNTLRWYKDAPLQLLIRAEPASEASAGNTGVVESRDYRGVPVLAAYTYITKTGWGLIAKQDRSEIYAPVRKMMLQIVVLYGISFCVIVFFALKISRSISLPITKMRKGAEEITRNNFDYPFPESRTDELGYLGKTFNRMRNVLKEKNREISMYRNHLEEQVRERTIQLENEIRQRKLLEFEVISISEKERQHIGQMLHDSLGQKLTGISYMIDALQKNTAVKDILYDKISDISQIIKESIEETRTISRGLCPFQTDYIKLEQALDELVSDFERIYNIHILLTNTASIAYRQIQTNVYYIIREALNNAVKHGNAKHITIDMFYKDRMYHIIITDDGHGFDRENTSPGLGIKILRYRVQIIGGACLIDTQPEKGTTITIKFKEEIDE